MIQLQFPSTMGMDFSGVIKQVGEVVSNSEFKQGDEVYGMAGVANGGSGAFAEMALAKTESIANKPKRLSHAEAAALPLVGVSAWRALVENIGLSKDRKILIHGGAGGIGSIAIQLAKHLGAYVATTVSTNDKQFVQELGADAVIDYKSQNFEDILHDYDAVFDTVGGDTYYYDMTPFKAVTGWSMSGPSKPPNVNTVPVPGPRRPTLISPLVKSPLTGPVA